MDLTAYQALQQETIAKLREAAADRPKHAAFLETLLASSPDDLWQIDRSPGVSEKAAAALREDVDWCLTPPVLAEDGKVNHRYTGHFVDAYATLRLADARRAGAVRRAHERAVDASGPEILRGLLQL